MRKPSRIAVYDIGTNSIHMKVVEIHDDLSFEVLDHEKDMTRIGEGSFKSNKLSKTAMKRGLRVLSRFAKMAREQGARTSVAIATSAVREARNGPAFLKSVYKKTGLRIRVVTGEEEGRLIFLGATSGYWAPKGQLLLVDVGGGSAEFVGGDSRRLDFSESMKLGVARLKDRFITKEPASKDNIQNLEDYVEDKLLQMLERIGRRKLGRTLIGTGGTMINLASMVYFEREKRGLRLRGYFDCDKKEIVKLRKKIGRLSVKKVLDLPAVERKRADILPTGAVLVAKMMKTLGAEKLRVSDKGIREGVILDYLMKAKMKLKKPRPNLQVQWFGQKPFFSGKIVRSPGRMK